ncbi:hypothetical protein OE88DRAFT_241719 [Heliocybe sulcata]|uniref:DUF6534 domain-containing protein n=1 Tax=Heliocybe sulcata TaxID=5364 RepID=A0A5C3MXU4_9AGAM|nr:hypothetical protein OE88DRAFT_241719 [Heliocybe sulcata]
MQLPRRSDIDTMRLSGIPDDVVQELGPLVMGCLLAYLLQGVLIVQICIYLSHPRYSSDVLPLKVTVWLVCVIELVCTMFVTAAAWVYPVKGWGDPDVLRQPTWTVAFAQVPNSIVALVVQLFFCCRMFLLNHRGLVPGFIGMAACVPVVMAVVGGIKSVKLPDVALEYRIMPYIVTTYGGSALCDIMIALNNIRLLYTIKKGSVFPDTQSLLMRNIKICMHTGIVTACFSIVHVATFLAMPSRTLHWVFLFIAEKIYSNTLLAVLNARRKSADCEYETTPSILFGLPVDDLRGAPIDIGA